MPQLYKTTLNVMNTTMQLALGKAGFKESRPKRAQWPRVRVKSIQVEVTSGNSVPFVR